MADIIQLSSKRGLDEISAKLLGVIASFDRSVHINTISEVVDSPPHAVMPYLYGLKKRKLVDVDYGGFRSDIGLERIARKYHTEDAQLVYPFKLRCDICSLRDIYLTLNEATITHSRSLISQDEVMHMLFTEGDRILMFAKGDKNEAMAFASRLANGTKRIGLWYAEPLSILSKFYEPEELYKLKVSR